MKTKLRHGSLFSGIGGFELAAEWMGWENVFHCEWNPFGARVLKYYWPQSTAYHDITKTDFSIHRGKIDIITGGFPCQPYSGAGKRLGKDDDRHLWPEMLRVIREVQPRWVVGENVLGLVNWNGGLVFDEVQADLEAEGYVVQPYVLPAASVNAPHKRYRVWFVAYADGTKQGDNEGEVRRKAEKVWGKDYKGDVLRELFGTWVVTDSDELGWNEGRTTGSGQNGQAQKERTAVQQQTDGLGGEWTASDTRGFRCNHWGYHWEERHLQENIDGNAEKGKSERYRRQRRSSKAGQAWLATNPDDIGLQGGEEQGVAGSERSFGEEQPIGYVCSNWENFPTQAPVCDGDDGLSARLDFDSVFEGVKNPRKPNIFGRWRTESIMAGGNAIVPKLALQLFETINKYELL